MNFTLSSIIIVAVILVIVFSSCQKTPVDYSKDINDLKALITQLQNRSDSLATALGNTNTNLSNLSKSVDSIKVKLTDIQTQIDALTLSLTTTNANITAINAQLVLLNQQYGSLLIQLNAILSILNAPPPTTLSSGLIAYYPFTGDAGDSSGNGNHGTVNAANLIIDRFGNLNSAYEFYQPASSISLPYLSELSHANQVALSFWKKYPDSIGTSNTIFQINYLFVLNVGNFPFSDRDTLSMRINSVGRATSITHQVSNKWNHMVIVIDGSKAPGERISVYQNGIFDTFLSCSEIFPLFTANDPISISNFSQYQSKRGYLDDFRIYNRTLTQSEITYLATH